MDQRIKAIRRHSLSLLILLVFCAHSAVSLKQERDTYMDLIRNYALFSLFEKTRKDNPKINKPFTSGPLTHREYTAGFNSKIGKVAIGNLSAKLSPDKRQDLKIIATRDADKHSEAVKKRSKGRKNSTSLLPKL